MKESDVTRPCTGMTWLRLACACIVLVGCAGSSGGDASSGSSGSGGDDGSSGAPGSGTSSGSGGGDDTGGPDPCTTVLGSDPAPIYTRTEGVFTLRSQPGYIDLVGHVAMAPQPDFHTETERQGACRLLRYDGDTCGAPCDAPTICVDGACIELPAYVSAGEVTLRGVGDEPIALAQDVTHTYYWDSTSDPTLTMPRLSSAGGEVDDFDLSACPVTAPTPTGDWSALLAARGDGEDVTLTWSDPIATARVYLRMTTGIGTHGGISPVEVECEAPDVGTLVLPGTFLDALYAEGWACGECGGNELIRYHGDETEGSAPTVQLRVTATTNFWHIP